ncbi:MAG TPA: hypothetical protein VM580_00585 [Labilithrix sp.]|nr:hypothetical protein [Labilithrix sp.]
MRGRFLLLAVVALLALGCSDYPHAYDENEIVFGIQQRTDAASGTSVVTADYEFLSLSRKGGWGAQVFRDGDGEGVCYFEVFDHRLGRPEVESGVARWTGGQLPQAGLQVLANQPAPSKIEGAGWGPNDALFFDVTGFAMPPLRTVAMYAPSVELAITAISPAQPTRATEMTIGTTDDVSVKWSPPAPHVNASRVMVTLETEDEAAHPHAGVRCFGSASSGSVVIPSARVSQLFSTVTGDKPIKGNLAVYSHRQVTYLARGGWVAYIVATTLHREQAFTGAR